MASQAKVLLRLLPSVEETTETPIAKEVVAREKDLPANEIKEAAEVATVSEVSVGPCKCILLKEVMGGQEVLADQQPAALAESLAVEAKLAMAETIAVEDTP